MPDVSAAAQVLLVTASYDRTLRFWEALSGICSRTLQHPDSQVNRVALSADKRYVAAAGNPNVRIYEALTQNPNHVTSLEGHTTNVTGVAFQNNCKWVVTCSEDGSVKIFDMRAKGPQRDYNHKSPVNDVIIHPNQAEIISCDQHGSIRIWDLAANACSHELVPEEDAQMKSVSIATDGSLLTAGTHKGNAYVWQMLPTKAGLLAASNVNPLTSASSLTQLKVLSNPNLATSSSAPQAPPMDPQAITWDLQPVTKIAAHQHYMLRSVLSPDVRHLATASADTTIRLWSINHPVKINMPDEATSSTASHQNAYSISLDKTLKGHQRWVWDCAWSADSEYLVSASSDHTAKLWDRRSGEAIRTYQGHHKAAVCVALNDHNL